MSNSLNPVTSDLTYFGREFLPALKNALIVAGMLPRADAATVIGGVATFPDIDVPSAASVRASGGAATASDILATSRSLSVQHIYQGVAVDNFQNLIAQPKLMGRLAERLAYNVARKADSIVCGLWNEWPYETGKLDGSAAFNSTDLLNPLVDARKILIDNQAPMDGLKCVLSTREAAAFRKIIQLQKVNEAGSSDLLRRGGLGSIMGFELFESQQVPDATLSAAAASSSPGSINNSGGYAIGTSAVIMAGLGSGTLLKGTTFTIAGTVTYRYVATADATITSNGATVSIYPALKEAVVDTAVVTFTEHSAASSMNFAFHPDAFSTVAAVGPPMRGGLESVVVSDEQTGLSVRLCYDANALGGAGVAYTESIAADLYFGAKTVRPEWVVKITGD